MSVPDDRHSGGPAVDVQMKPGEGLYAYCFADAQKICGRKELFCHDDGVAVWSFAVGGIAALVRVTALADFCDGTAEARLSDLSWVGPRACRHQAVTEQAMRFSPVFPVGFGTLFRSYASLAEFLLCHRIAIRKFLDRVDGKREWAIKAYAVQERIEAMAALAADRCPELAAQPPGTRYLRRRQLQPALAAALLADAVASAATVADRLAGFASEARTLNTSQAMVPAERLFAGNFVFLVDAASTEAFCGEVQRLTHEASGLGLELALSGPWPPFSFLPALGSTSATTR